MPDQLREAAQALIDALGNTPRRDSEVLARAANVRAALAEPDQTAQAHLWATELATHLARMHWPEITEWKPLPDLVGVISQIDNMTDHCDRIVWRNHYYHLPVSSQAVPADAQDALKGA